jgi:hypothetical protein
MTGSGLMDFLIALVVLGGIAVLFFLVIDAIAPDATLAKIGRIAVGLTILVIFLLMVKGVLFGGGGAAPVNASGLITFAIGAIVVIVVLYLIKMALGWFGGEAGLGQFTNAILYVICAIALIALLILAANTFLGGTGSLGHLGGVR